MSAHEAGSSARLTIAMLIFPGMTLQDVVGPHTAWNLDADIFLVWETTEPVLSGDGITVTPTHSFQNCPRNVDILFVPGGGNGTWTTMENGAALHFLREMAGTAKYVTSVCTGSLILAAAGLIQGRRAATHWATYDILRDLGVDGVRERVVVDGNLLTGGGVTAGIDFGLSVLASLRGAATAKRVQLAIEYNPQPPFDAGSPATAGRDVTMAVTDWLQEVWVDHSIPVVQRVQKRIALTDEASA